MAIKFLNTVAVDTNVLYVNAATNKVGIGTAAPESELHVNGNVLLSNNKELRWLNSAGAQESILELNGSDLLSLTSPGRIRIVPDGNAAIDLFSGHNTKYVMSSVHSWEDNNSNVALRITAGGNVGIGTDSPSQKLEVAGNIELGTGGYIYGDTTTSYLRLNTAVGSLLGYSNAYIGLGPSFVYNVGGSEKFRIQSSTGYVGIGTTSPSKKLTVNGQTQFYEYSGAHLTNAAHSNFNFDTLANNSSSLSGGSLGAFIKVTGSPTGATGTWSAIRSRAYGENTQGNTDNLINFFAEYRNYTSTNAVTLNHHAGLKVQSLGVGGLATVTNNYGVYLDVGTAATNNYGVYQAGASVKNFFQGNVGIGTTSPSEKLDVAGNISVYNSYAAGASLFLNHSNQYSSSIIKSIADTIDSQDSGSSMLRFYTNDNSTTSPTVALDLTSESNAIFYGKVGIGTTSPSEKLDVAGNTIVRGDIVSRDTYPSIYVDHSGTAMGGIRADATNKLELKTLTTAPLSFQVNSSEKMRIQTNGNVGIGTTSPSSKLQVSADNGDGITLQHGASNAFYILRSGNDDTIIKQTRNYTSKISISTLADSGTHESSGLNIVGQGSGLKSNIGIGTNSPSEKLEVLGYAKASTGFKAGNYTILNESGNETSLGNSAYYPMFFKTNNSVRMTISNGGNVGIGTTSPTNYKLQVNGTVESSAFSVEGASARIFAPSGANYNGSGVQTGFLIAKLPDNGASGINNMMTGVIRVFDYAHNESFDVHFAGYWYSGYNWTNCSAWIDSTADVDRNFTVRFGRMTGSAGANTRPYITIGEATSAWTYCKFSVINFEPGHSNLQAYKWDKGWSMEINATSPGNVLVTKSNAQVNNWQRNGQNVYYGSGTGKVGIGTASPSHLLTLEAESSAVLKIKDTTQGATLLAFSQDSNSHIGTYSEHPLVFDTNSTEAMRITSAGRVGIGTTTPSAALEVVGGIKLLDNYPLTWATSNTRIFGQSGYMQLQVAGSDAMRLTSAGNVGIGNIAPGEKLEVSGNVKAETLIATDLTDGYVPYSKSGTLGLQDSKIYTQGAGIGVGTTTLAAGCHITSLSDISATGYRVSAMQTAPAARNSTGTLGEIRITSNYIYVCYATNSWSRVALATSW